MFPAGLSGGESYLYADIGFKEIESLGSDRSAGSNIFNYDYERALFNTWDGKDYTFPAHLSISLGQ